MLSQQIAGQTALDEMAVEQWRSVPFVAIFDADGTLVAAQKAEHEAAPFATGAGSSEEAALVRELVRRYASRWTSEQRANLERVLIKPDLLATLIPLGGPGGTFVGIAFERFATREALARSIATFHITRREAEVLRLILDGLPSSLIAGRLHISQATAQGHVKRLLGKTESRNRAHMAARVLGWRGGEH
jgi:DNA-binding CsgD family transcriptional regulator